MRNGIPQAQVTTGYFHGNWCWILSVFSRQYPESGCEMLRQKITKTTTIIIINNNIGNNNLQWIKIIIRHFPVLSYDCRIHKYEHILPPWVRRVQKETNNSGYTIIILYKVTPWVYYFFFFLYLGYVFFFKKDSDLRKVYYCVKFIL